MMAVLNATLHIYYSLINPDGLIFCQNYDKNVYMEKV